MEIHDHPSYPLLMAVRRRLRELESTPAEYTSLEYPAMRLLEDTLRSALLAGTDKATRELAWLFMDMVQDPALSTAIGGLKGRRFR